MDLTPWRILKLTHQGVALFTNCKPRWRLYVEALEHTGLMLSLDLFLHSSVSSSVRSMYTHTHTRPFNGPFSGTTQVSRYQKGKTNLDFTEARDGEW